jgi:hypothetical protein
MEAPPLERKLVAILAADVASYSRLMAITRKGRWPPNPLFALSRMALSRSTRGEFAGPRATAFLPHSAAVGGGPTRSRHPERTCPFEQ